MLSKDCNTTSALRSMHALQIMSLMALGNVLYLATTAIAWDTYEKGARTQTQIVLNAMAYLCSGWI
jgi:uncharacterized membrane protein YqjE